MIFHIIKINACFIDVFVSSLKTSFFKRKPDYDAAAQYYAQAGTCYKVAKDLNRAIDSFKKSAEFYKQNDSLYHAAK